MRSYHCDTAESSASRSCSGRASSLPRPPPLRPHLTIAAPGQYLAVDAGEGADAQLEAPVYDRFLDPDSRKTFFDACKEIEALWEILAPSAELRDKITKYKRLSQLYASVRNAYAETSGFVADLAHKT